MAGNAEPGGEPDTQGRGALIAGSSIVSSNSPDDGARPLAKARESRPPIRRSVLGTSPQVPDLSRPNAARIYDYFLGGGLNTEVDRVFAREAMAIFPGIQPGARDNRKFLQRAVRYMTDQGVHQFLDLGCGIPTVGSSWEIARLARPDARVICVDNESVAVHATEEAIQRDPERYKHIEVIQADFTNPHAIFQHPYVQAILNPSQPVGILMVAVLHFLKSADQARDVVRRYMSWAAHGSYLAVSVAAADAAPPWQQAQLDQFVKKYENSSSRLYLRGHDEVRSWLTGLSLVSPSSGRRDSAARLAHLPDWLPEDIEPQPDSMNTNNAHYCAWCGVAQKTSNSYPNNPEQSQAS